MRSGLQKNSSNAFHVKDSFNPSKFDSIDIKRTLPIRKKPPTKPPNPRRKQGTSRNKTENQNIKLHDPESSWTQIGKVESVKLKYKVKVRAQRDLDNKTIYLIEASEIDGAEFSTAKRYSELLQFFEFLNKRYPTFLLPSFPNRNQGSRSLDQTRFRIKKLTRFFNLLFNSVFKPLSVSEMFDEISKFTVQDLKGKLQGVFNRNFLSVKQTVSNAVGRIIFKKPAIQKVSSLYDDLKELNFNLQILNDLHQFLSGRLSIFALINRKGPKLVEISDFSLPNPKWSLKLEKIMNVESKQKGQPIGEFGLIYEPHSVTEEKNLFLNTYRSRADSGKSNEESEGVNRSENSEQISQTYSKTLDESDFGSDSREEFDSESFQAFNSQNPEIENSVQIENSRNGMNPRSFQAEKTYLMNNGNLYLQKFPETISIPKFDSFFELDFLVKCEIDDIITLKNILFRFLGAAFEPEELEKICLLSIDQQSDLKKAFYKK